MTKSIFEDISLSKKDEKRLKYATSREYIDKVKKAEAKKSKDFKVANDIDSNLKKSLATI